MGLCFCQWSIAVAAFVLLLNYGNSLPLQSNNGNSERAIEIEQMVTTINENIVSAESDARVSRIFYMTNITFDGELADLPQKIFAQLLLSSGFEKMEGTVPMTWNEITSLEGPFDGKNSSLCEGVFKPDHLLSKVILENLVSSNPSMEQEVMNELKQLFCSNSVKQISMHFMQTDDVISGLIVLSILNDRSLLALANVGF